MHKEKDTIRLIDSMMPKSPYKLNRLFECDSEAVEFNGNRLLFNVDEFSKEDLLREHDPYSLGWNAAVGSVADILAAGGKPVFYLHSMVVGNDWDKDYIRLFSKGVADVLDKAGIGFLGGDFGKSENWRYTVTVVGVSGGRTLFRCGASEGDSIYLTGEIGAGNLEAFLKLYEDKKIIGTVAKKFKNRFKTRFEEAELIGQYATACIDTSDGVFNAVNTLSEMSGTGFELQDLNYIRFGKSAAKLFALPQTLLFLGECGEYELLFTVGKQGEDDFVREGLDRGLKFKKIGKVTDASSKVLYEGSRKYDFRKLDISARDFIDMKQYIKELVKFLKA